MRAAVENRLITGGIALALSIIVVMALVSNRNAGRLAEAEDWRAHSLRAHAALGGLLATLNDVETGHRGYLITGDPRDLERFHDALRFIGPRLAEVARLTADDQDQQGRLDYLRPLISGRITRLEASIEARTAQGFAAARDRFLASHGRELRDQILRLIGEMQRREERLLAAREARLQTSARAARVTQILGSILSPLLLLAAFHLLRRQIAERRRTEAELRREGDLRHAAKVCGILEQEVSRLRGKLDRLQREL